jgi:heme exporter protein B
MLPALFVLGVLVLVTFHFSLAPKPEEALRLAPGILWVAVVLASVLALGRTFLAERENGCIDGLLTSPLDRGSIFLAKLAVNTLLLFAFEALLLPVFALLYNVPITGNLAALVVVLAGGGYRLTGAKRNARRLSAERSREETRFTGADPFRPLPV